MQPPVVTAQWQYQSAEARELAMQLRDVELVIHENRRGQESGLLNHTHGERLPFRVSASESCSDHHPQSKDTP